MTPITQNHDCQLAAARWHVPRWHARKGSVKGGSKASYRLAPRVVRALFGAVLASAVVLAHGSLAIVVYALARLAPRFFGSPPRAVLFAVTLLTFAACVRPADAGWAGNAIQEKAKSTAEAKAWDLAGKGAAKLFGFDDRDVALLQATGKHYMSGGSTTQFAGKLGAHAAGREIGTAAYNRWGGAVGRWAAKKALGYGLSGAKIALFSPCGPAAPLCLMGAEWAASSAVEAGKNAWTGVPQKVLSKGVDHAAGRASPDVADSLPGWAAGPSHRRRRRAPSH